MEAAALVGVRVGDTESFGSLKGPGSFPDVSKQRSDFIAQWGIQSSGELQVEATLLQGAKRADFFKQAQALSIELHQADPEKYTAPQVIWPETLKRMQAAPEHTTGVATQRHLSIRGDVTGVSNVSIADLPVLHVAYYILNGQDLFANRIIQSNDNGVYWNGIGLHATKASVAASAEFLPDIGPKLPRVS